MKLTTSGAEVEYDAGGWLVTVEDWAVSDSIRLTTVKRHESGSLELIGVVFVDFCPECRALARAVIRGECPPPILADWIEDHPEWWRCPGEVRDAAAEAICERLRMC